MTMKLPESVPALLLFLTLHSMLLGNALAQKVTFSVRNKCSFPIWPATAPNEGEQVIANGGFYLPSGQTKRITAPSTWSGRLWARTGCPFRSDQRSACETGDCGGRLECNGQIGKPPVTLVQIALQGGQGNPNFYDVSVVDGYNLPVSVAPRSASSRCSIRGCTKNLKRSCPRELKVTNDKGEIVACKSACLAFNTDAYCCTGEYDSEETCKPSRYSRLFKDACPTYYTYAYDSPPPLVSCPGNEYEITFCPSTWGGEHISMYVE